MKTTQKLTNCKYKDFLRTLPKSDRGQSRQDSPPVDPNLLNNKQNKVYRLVSNHLQQNSVSPLRIIVHGISGSGKTFLVKTIRPLLEKHNRKYVVCSATGVSSNLIKGATIHSTFKLQLGFWNKCPGSGIGSLNYFRNVDYIILDELSLIGCGLLGYISKRLKSICQSEDDFADKSLILLGDFSQLPAVKDFVLFTSPDRLQELPKLGASIYRNIKNAVVLDESVRQVANDAQCFRELLKRARKGIPAKQDLAQLHKREASVLSEQELQLFCTEDTVHLFAEKKAAVEYNQFRISQFPQRIVVKSEDTPKNEIEHSLTIAVGCRVQLTRNISVEHGLFNGAIGTITEFGPCPANSEVPEFIFIKFDSYRGPRFGLRSDIPLSKYVSTEYCNQTKLTWRRLQFPLDLSYGLTTHRAQGLTLKRVVIHIPSEGNSSLFFRLRPSLCFVALSRVASLSDIVFAERFRAKAIQAARQPAWILEEDRLLQLEQND